MAPSENPSLSHQSAEDELELRESLLSQSDSATSARTPEVERGMPAMGNKYASSGSEGRRTDGLAALLALGSVAFTIIMTWIVVLTRKPSTLGWFAFHPLLQSLSLGFFTYGILTLQTTSQANPQAKAAGLVRHQGVVFGLGVPAIFAGAWAVWHNKNLRGANHYTTWHGTFGAITLGWIAIQVFIGAGSVWFNGKLFGGGAKAKSFWKYHRMSGYLLLPLLLLTTHLGGAWSTWAENNTAWIVRVLAFGGAPLILLAALYARARPSKMGF